jgi:hypothetical protein
MELCPRWSYGRTWKSAQTPSCRLIYENEAKKYYSGPITIAKDLMKF